MIDIHSETWRSVKKHCEDRRERLVDELIAGSNEDDLLRGEIRFIDRLLKIEDRREKPPIPSTRYL